MLPESLQQNEVVVALEAAHGDAIVDGNSDFGETTLEIAPERIVAILGFLKSQQRFERLASVTAVDRHPMEPRFEVVYHLQSITRNLRLRLKCRVSGVRPEIESATSVYSGANWYERETFDLFGVVFTGHPDLRRIMMPDDWEGHPLRRDFPTHGYKYSYGD